MNILENKVIYTASLLMGTVLATPQAAGVDAYTQSLIVRQLLRTPASLQRDVVAEGAIQKATAEKISASPPPILSARDILLSLKEGGFSISAIAEMMRVERKTVYAWLSGSAVKQSNEERIEDIYSLLSEAKIASYRNLSRYMNKNVAGVTLAKLLKAEVLDEPAIEKTLTALWPLAHKTETQLSRNTSYGKTGNPVLGGIPEVFISDEEA